MATVKHINVYYIGGLANPNAIVSAKGMSFHVPPIGEHLNVPYYIARDLIRRNSMPDGRSVFTTDAGMVKKLIAEAAQASKATPTKFSREQLLEMLNDLEEDIQEDNKAAVKAAKAAKKEEVA